jgi:hypothetical protein
VWAPRGLRIQGTLIVHPAVTVGRGSLDVLTSRDQSRAALLAAVGLTRPRAGDRLRSFGVIRWTGASSLDAQVGQGATSCTDTVGLGRGIAALGGAAAHLTVSFDLGSDVTQTDLRTRCPGPFGPQGEVAIARVPLTALRRRTGRSI